MQGARGVHCDCQRPQAEVRDVLRVEGLVSVDVCMRISLSLYIYIYICIYIYIDVYIYIYIHVSCNIHVRIARIPTHRHTCVSYVYYMCVYTYNYVSL